LIKLEAVGAELVRYGFSSQAGAAIVNATLQAYKKLFKPDIDVAQICVDKSKLDR